MQDSGKKSLLNLSVPVRGVYRKPFLARHVKEGSGNRGLSAIFSLTIIPHCPVL